ncbi:MAG: hypothetical protein ND866_04235 [Pyrinomonadaceae bacterium]|nr:hypothetical protein [Pyrinomonadaceae bacterium]
MNDKLQSDIERGDRANRITNDPVMVEAKAHIEAELWRLFKSTIPTDLEALSQIKAMQYMHEKYAAFLNSCINDGKMAKLEIERSKKPLRERIFG